MIVLTSILYSKWECLGGKYASFSFSQLMNDKRVGVEERERFHLVKNPASLTVFTLIVCGGGRGRHMLMHTYMVPCRSGHREVRRQLVRLGSLLPPFAFQDSNRGCQVWWQAL